MDILQLYGLSEAFLLTSESWAHKVVKSGSVGKAAPGNTLKVCDKKHRIAVNLN